MPPAPTSAPKLSEFPKEAMIGIVVLIVIILGIVLWLFLRPSGLSDEQKINRLGELPNNPSADNLSDQDKSNLLHGQPAGE